MPDHDALHATPPVPPTRRRFLVAGLTILAAGVAGGRVAMGQASPETTPGISSDEQAVRDRAKAVGISPIQKVEGTRYLVIGDAPETFQKAALALCDDLAKDYLDHFQGRGFAVSLPEGRLTVVALSGPKAFADYLGVSQEQAVGGIYDLETNRLVMFDNRARANAGPKVERANTVALIHEATHQLTFNSGLLNRQGDIPLAVSEGLAMYGEVMRPRGRGEVGDVNIERLKVLVAHRDDPWFRSSTMLENDAPFTNPADEQLALAQAWLLTYHLMTERDQLPKFRAYLDAIRPRTDASHRLEDAKTTLGDLDALDRDLSRKAALLVRRHAAQIAAP